MKPRKETQRIFWTAACGWTVCALAFAALASGCSPPTTGSGVPRVAAAPGVATPVALRSSSSSASTAAVAVPTPGVAAPQVASDVMERELGTASDGGYLAYPAR